MLGGRGPPLYYSQADITPSKDHLKDITPNKVRIGGQGPPDRLDGPDGGSGRVWIGPDGPGLFSKKGVLVRDGRLNTPFGRLNTPFRTPRWTPKTKKGVLDRKMFCCMFFSSGRVRTRPPARTLSTYPNYVRSNVL